MTAREQLRSLLAEIGPVLDLAEVYEAPGGRTWTLTVQDGATLFVDLMPDPPNMRGGIERKDGFNWAGSSWWSAFLATAATASLKAAARRNNPGMEPDKTS